MQDGASFILLADDPAAAVDLQAWSRMTGHHCAPQGDGAWMIEKRIKD